MTPSSVEYATERTAAERIADELIRIGKAAPRFRAQQLGSSTEVVRAFAEAGEIEAEVARDNLLVAAVRAGIDVKEASRIIQRAWPAAPAYTQHVGRCDRTPLEPEGFGAVAAKLCEGFDGDRTREFPTALVCAANGLDRLADHIRSVDDRRAGMKPGDRWALAAASLALIPDHLAELVDAIGRRLPDDHLADGVVVAVMLYVQIAVDLGLDLGEALARNVTVGAGTPA